MERGLLLWTVQNMNAFWLLQVAATVSAAAFDLLVFFVVSTSNSCEYKLIHAPVDRFKCDRSGRIKKRKKIVVERTPFWQIGCGRLQYA